MSISPEAGHLPYAFLRGSSHIARNMKYLFKKINVAQKSVFSYPEGLDKKKNNKKKTKQIRCEFRYNAIRSVFVSPYNMSHVI